MARNAVYRVPYRRRRERRTDFRSRKILLQSRKPRFVVRRSNKYIQAQVVLFETTGDRTVVNADSRELAAFGWKKGTKNIPAAYLTGYLAGKKAQAAKISEGVLDIGLRTSQPGGRIYAALKGIIDSGIAIPHGEAIIPAEDRLKGAHISEDIADLVDTTKKKIEKV